MLKQKIWSLYEIYLAVSFDEVVTNTLDVVYDDELDALVFYSLGEVYEYFIIVLQSLAMGENNVFADLLLRNFVLILHQKVFFYFVKSLLI